MVNFISQKLKSKHLVCLSFLWWQICLRGREEIFYKHSALNNVSLHIIKWNMMLHISTFCCIGYKGYLFLVNPKQCGLFGQLRRQEGSKMAHWEKAVSGCFNFHPSSTNNISYESLQFQLKFETSVRLLRLIVWPQEVSEVTEVKVRKIFDENPKIANFWLTEM